MFSVGDRVAYRRRGNEVCTVVAFYNGDIIIRSTVTNKVYNCRERDLQKIVMAGPSVEHSDLAAARLLVRMRHERYR